MSRSVSEAQMAKGPLGGRRAWVVAASAALLALTAMALMPVGSIESAVLGRVIGITCVIVFVVAARQLPRGVRLVWWSMGAFLALTVITDVVYEYGLRVHGEVASPGLTDAMYLASYLLALVALAGLVRLQRPGRDLLAWIDTGILASAAVSLGGVFIIGPLLRDFVGMDVATVVSVAYPTLDLVLLAALLRTAMSPGANSPAMALLVAAMSLFLFADLTYNVLATSASGATEPWWLEVLWTGALICMAMAVSAPGARTLASPRRSGPGQVGQMRLVAIGIAVLTTPVLLSVTLWVDKAGLAAWLSLLTILVVVLMLWRIGVLVRAVQVQAETERHLAGLDSLTGLPNRRTWDSELGNVAAHTRAHQLPLTIAVLDLDHFKDFNDSRGHQAGDEVLAAAAEAWRRHLGDDDVLARYGGEEFGLMLPGQQLDAAFETLEQLRLAMPFNQTVSIGAAQVMPDEDPTNTFRRADIALYRAKADGRDCVRLDRVGAPEGFPSTDPRSSSAP